jgi:hypothetical protein
LTPIGYAEALAGQSSNLTAKLIACKTRQHPNGELRERCCDDRAFALTTGRSSFLPSHTDFDRTARRRTAISVVTQPLEKTDMPRTVADQFAEPLAAAGVKCIYGVVATA